jgi:hypothetical protein
MADHIAVVYDACVLYPDVFISDFIDRYPQQVLDAIDTTLLRLKNPPQTFTDHLETLANQGLTTSVAMLRDLRYES